MCVYVYIYIYLYIYIYIYIYINTHTHTHTQMYIQNNLRSGSDQGQSLTRAGFDQGFITNQSLYILLISRVQKLDNNAQWQSAGPKKARATKPKVIIDGSNVIKSSDKQLHPEKLLSLLPCVCKYFKCTPPEVLVIIDGWLGAALGEHAMAKMRGTGAKIRLSAVGLSADIRIRENFGMCMYVSVLLLLLWLLYVYTCMYMYVCVCVCVLAV